MNKTKHLTKIIFLLIAILMLSSVMILPATAASTPAAPESITVTRSTSAIKLTWPKVSGATGYRIYYKSLGDSSWKTALKSTTATNYTLKNLSAGKSYSFAVRSYTIANGKTTMGGYNTIKTATKTNAPKNLEATQSSSSIKLTWSKVPEATGYKIYYKTSASASWKTIVSSTKSTSYTFNNLDSGKKYFFAVKSYVTSSFGTFYGKYSTIETATKPATPTLKVTSTEAGKVKVTWSDVSGETGYQIYYSTSKDSGYKKINTVKANCTSANVSDLKQGKTYYFRVRAYITVSGTTIYGGYKTASVTVKSSTTKLTNESAYQIFKTANQVFLEWWLPSQDKYSDKSVEYKFKGDDATYWKVCHKSIKSKADLKTYFRNYFTDKISDRLLNYYKDYNGELYRKNSGGIGGVLAGATKGTIISQNSNVVVLELEIKHFDKDIYYEPRYIYLVYNDGKWVLDDPLDEYRWVPIVK